MSHFERSHLMSRDCFKLSTRGGSLPWLLAAALLGASAASVAALEIPQRYVVRGRASATVSGPGCCGATVFGGPAELAYAIDAAGQVTFSRIEMHADDTDVPIREPILGLEVGTAHLRCSALVNAGAALGSVEGPGRLKLPPGAASVSGLSFEERLADGSCITPNAVLVASNDSTIEIEHDPDGDRFRLTGSLRARIEDHDYVVSLQMDATYANRPPVPRLGVVYPEHDQGGCPGRWVPNPAGWLVEANDPGGLRASLRSDSIDPDGSWARADIQSERWFWGPAPGPVSLLGAGQSLGPFSFGFDTVHGLELLVSDRAGAAAEERCEFRVVDTTPPVVTAPAPGSVACTVMGGATLATSAAVQSFLASARAFDVADPAPAWLTPLADGNPVSGTTLFKLDVDTGGAGTGVKFRSRDRFGNTGSAESRLHVVDAEPPAASLSLGPAALFPNGAFWPIAASIAASDRCGPVTVWLSAIRSDFPALDAVDIAGASFGTDDRSFLLRARTPAPGVPRTYRVVYGVRDRSGNTKWLEQTILVRGRP